MKKSILGFLLLSCLFLVSCGQTEMDINYTDDEPFILDMNGESLKVLQLTDLHLTYGVDNFDRKTLHLIQDLILSDDFDFVVITGDMSLSPLGISLFKKLIKTMEECETPWSFVFGNHETDYHDYSEYLNSIPETEYLYFKVGPELNEGGVGNFVVRFEKDGEPFYDLILMDTHAEREVYTEEEGEYDYLKTSQITWYEDHVSSSVVNNLVFMHIPLREFIDSEGYIGIFDEDKVYAQGVNTGFFDACVTLAKTKGVFVGHDHLNDFYLLREDIILAYGRITGYSAYGDLERGGRVIEVMDDQEIVLSVLLESEVSQ